jgi:hypothetical protein
MPEVTLFENQWVFGVMRLSYVRPCVVCSMLLTTYFVRGERF